jgi:hypothetical protein
MGNKPRNLTSLKYPWTTVVFGRSGSGKTTLLRTVAEATNWICIDLEHFALKEDDEVVLTREGAELLALRAEEATTPVLVVGTVDNPEMVLHILKKQRVRHRVGVLVLPLVELNHRRFIRRVLKGIHSGGMTSPSIDKKWIDFAIENDDQVELFSSSAQILAWILEPIASTSLQREFYPYKWEDSAGSEEMLAAHPLLKGGS